MPHLTIHYTANLECQARISQLCQALATSLAGQRDAGQGPLFPLHGTRVLAYPAPHHAVADGQPDQGFIYLNLRITPGRERALVDQAGQALIAVVRAHFDAMAPAIPFGLTLHIDEQHPAFEGRYRSPAT